jgi:hypothetical protein
MVRKCLAATLLAAVLVLSVSISYAQQGCPVPAAGTRVQLTPDVTVTAVECPAGLLEGKTVLEYSDWRALTQNRRVTMWVRPYPPGTMSEVAFTLNKGFNDYDSNSSIDAFVKGSCGGSRLDIKRMGIGRYCGHGDFAPGWNRISVWVTTPFSSELASFDIWAGDLKDKPRMVNWQCPACRVTTTSVTCPVCKPACQ